MTRPARPIKVYRHPLSGHCHRVELFLSLLGLPVELIDVDLAAGAHRTPALLELNPFGQELGKAHFLAGAAPTIADIANYTYIAHAPEGNVSLAPYPQLRAWLQRIESLPRFVAMPKTSSALAA